MGRGGRKRELVGPWRSIHGAIWLIGLAILIWQGWMWPGILVLIAISGILEALLSLWAPQAFEPEPGAEPVVAAAQPAPEAPVAEHRLELLPSACPKCNAPIRGGDVKWTGPQSADCPYCGANLPMRG